MTLPGFPDFSPRRENGRCTITWQRQASILFTDRSGDRELSMIRERISRLRQGHRLLLVTAYHPALAGLFDDESPFVLVAPVNYADDSPRDGRFVGDAAALNRFINEVGGEDKFEIFIPPAWGAAREVLTAAARDILRQAAVRLKTIRHFGRLWPVNFRLNAQRLENYGDIGELGITGPPDALVMAGPSLDSTISEVVKTRYLWCADTALPALLARGIFPRVIFSVDAGFASLEHFVGAVRGLAEHRMILVSDLTAQPAIQRLPFARILTYAGSHPLVQSLMAGGRRFTALVNSKGDVGSLMVAAHEALFAQAPRTFGHDGGQRRYITHARGTAYFRRTYSRQNRLNAVETYMFSLSRRYA